MFNKLALGVVALLTALSVQASVITFTNRAAFQAAVSGYTVDNLNNLRDAEGANANINRGAYAIHVRSFGCSSGPGQCGNNSSQGFLYPAYLWTYEAGTFDFVNGINAFGLDFGMNGSAAAAVTLNGVQYSKIGGGFFGIVDTSNSFKSVSYAARGSGSLLDNVTFGVIQKVPEPGSLALLLAALAGFGLLRRRAA